VYPVAPHQSIHIPLHMKKWALLSCKLVGSVRLACDGRESVGEKVWTFWEAEAVLWGKNAITGSKK